jgi:hypothetical protein
MPLDRELTEKSGNWNPNPGIADLKGHCRPSIHLHRISISDRQPNRRFRAFPFAILLYHEAHDPLISIPFLLRLYHFNKVEGRDRWKSRFEKVRSVTAVFVRVVLVSGPAWFGWVFVIWGMDQIVCDNTWALTPISSESGLRQFRNLLPGLNDRR